MYWVILIAGLALWWAAHLFKRVAPTRREAMGKRGAGIVAGLLAVSIILTVIGYRGTEFVPVWNPPSFLTHINNLMVLVALYMMSPAGKKGKLISGMRHPMTMGFGLWALAHLLVNGDLTAILTFGSFLIWAFVTIKIINKAQPEWTPNTVGTYAKDAMFAAGSVILLAVIGMIHMWLGVSPFS